MRQALLPHRPSREKQRMALVGVNRDRTRGEELPLPRGNSAATVAALCFCFVSLASFRAAGAAVAGGSIGPTSKQPRRVFPRRDWFAAPSSPRTGEVGDLEAFAIFRCRQTRFSAMEPARESSGNAARGTVVALVKLVKQHPHIYDSTMGDHKDKDLIGQSWLQISKEMRLGGEPLSRFLPTHLSPLLSFSVFCDQLSSLVRGTSVGSMPAPALCPRG